MKTLNRSITALTATLSLALIAPAAFITAHVAAPSVAHADVEDELAALQKSFAERKALVSKAADAGKLGETTAGMVDVREGGGESIDGGGKSMTVSNIVSEENADRKKLYQLLAQKTGESESDIAKQNAIRNFQNAKPDHWLKLKDGSWKQRKDIG